MNLKRIIILVLKTIHAEAATTSSVNKDRIQKERSSMMEAEAKETDSIYLAYNHFKNINFASPDMRNIYLKKAQEYFENGNYSLSAYYQLEALCFRHNTINHFGYINSKTEKFDFVLPNNNKEHSNELLDFANENNLKYLSEENNTSIKIFDPEKEIPNMINFIKILPQQWTVINICKGYDVNMTISTKNEILNAELPLFLTIIKHPRSEEFPDIQPIIQLNGSNIPKSFYELLEIRCKEQYNKESNIIDNKIAQGIKSLSKTIGAWVCLLTGNVHENDIKTQQQIFAEVDAFCNKFNLNNFNRILLSMLVPHVKYLSENDIMNAIQQLIKDGNSLLSKTIFNFLINQKGETYYMYPLTPCILIIDELLDHFPWEMLNTTQEICRISSYNILKQLYMKFKNEILNGYLHIDVKNGNCIINPDKNLNSMEKRLKLFFNYWLPHWNCIYSDIPTNEKIEEIFSSEGIYVYCGHGSGMHLLNNYKTEITKIAKSVTFLFGCESVRLTSTGLHAEFKGEHIYFHGASCPAVVGLLNVGFDFTLDNYSTRILSTWIPSKNKAHWSTFNKVQWRKGILVAETNQQNSKNEYEPRLAAILSKIRSDSTQKLHNIVGLVYRGLPVWNTNACL